MARPTRLGALGLRIDPHRASPGLVNLSHTEPHPPHSRVTQPHRGLDHYLLNNAAPNPIPRLDSPLHQHRPRHQHHTRHHMISQPRLQTHRHPPTDHHTTRIRNLHHRTQHRMLHRIQPHPRHISRHTRIQPKP